MQPSTTVVALILLGVLWGGATGCANPCQTTCERLAACTPQPSDEFVPTCRTACEAAGAESAKGCVDKTECGVLSACMSPTVDRLRVGYARDRISKLSTLLVIHAADEDFPSTLDALTRGPSAISPGDIRDPWGRPFQYAYPSVRDGDAEFDLCSAGPDGQAGSGDDICSE